MASQHSETLEQLLFKATNPANKIEDVNTIKAFCDAVSAANSAGDGPAIACKLLAHKIQSPQDREATQALAVLEAAVKACGAPLAAEVGKFKFLNEMIKLVSPKYLGSRTPEHIQKKVLELLYVWSRELDEPKIAEAYAMLKEQGIVEQDPDHVGAAVCTAAALPPRADAPLTEEQQKELKRLLQSKSPEDLEKANKIIKGMVQEDERKMDLLARRSTELVMVNNNVKLLNEMLDHYDKGSARQEEVDLLAELKAACVKMQPKLFRLASDTDEDDEAIGEVLQASDELSKALDRYKMVVTQGKPDITKARERVARQTSSANSESLLDLGPAPSKGESNGLDDDILGLEAAFTKVSTGTVPANTQEQKAKLPVPPGDLPIAMVEPATPNATSQQPSIDDLLNGSPINTSAPSLLTSNLPAVCTKPLLQLDPFAVQMEEKKQSRQRGLEELDLLGETAIKSHLTTKSPQFEKKVKVPLNALAEKKKEADLAPPVAAQTAKQPTNLTQTLPSASLSPAKSKPEPTLPSKSQEQPEPSPPAPSKPAPTPSDEPIKLADLEVPLSTIKPGSTPPLTLQDDPEGLCIVLHFGRDSPRPHVTPVVVTMINKSSQDMQDFELKCILPKGCKVKLQEASSRELKAHNPFVPPPAITQVMLLAVPPSIPRPVSLKYVLSYLQDEEPQTEMGECKELPIS